MLDDLHILVRNLKLLTKNYISHKYPDLLWRSNAELWLEKCLVIKNIKHNKLILFYNDFFLYSF